MPTRASQSSLEPRLHPAALILRQVDFMEFKTTLHQILGYDESAPEVLALFIHFDSDRSG